MKVHIIIKNSETFRQTFYAKEFPESLLPSFLLPKKFSIGGVEVEVYSSEFKNI